MNNSVQQSLLAENGMSRMSKQYPNTNLLAGKLVSSNVSLLLVVADMTTIE